MHQGAAFNESSIRLGVKQDSCPRERSAGAVGRDNGRMMCDCDFFKKNFDFTHALKMRRRFASRRSLLTASMVVCGVSGPVWNAANRQKKSI